LVEVGDYEKFVNKILFFRDNLEQYNKFSKNALKQAGDFSWEKNVDRLDSILDNKI